MTRINLVPYTELYDQHLMAEYYELPRVIDYLKKSLKSVNNDVQKLKEKIPTSYTLNKGHVYFFYDKGYWLYRRYWGAVIELEKRNFKINPEKRELDWGVFGENGLFYNPWQPNAVEIELSRQRINERVAQKPNWFRKTTYEL